MRLHRDDLISIQRRLNSVERNVEQSQIAGGQDGPVIYDSVLPFEKRALESAVALKDQGVFGLRENVCSACCQRYTGARAVSMEHGCFSGRFMLHLRGCKGELHPKLIDPDRR